MTKIINVRKKRRKRKLSNVLFDIFLYTFLILVAAVTLVPFLQVLTISMSPQSVVAKSGLHLIPTKFDFSGYEKVFHYPLVWTAYLNTIIRAALGTGLSVLLYIIGAYPLSKKYLPHKKAWTLFVIFTMYFSGGIIPSFLLYNWLGLYDNYLVYVIPALFGGFYNVIIFNANFKAIPESLFESAKLDGANELRIYASIVMPLSKPVLTALGVFTACGVWNDYSATLFYTQSASLQTLGSYTLKLVKSSQAAEQLAASVIQSNQQVAALVNSAMGSGEVTAKTIELASMVLTALPVIIAYPFAQKFFTKGVMVGSVKG